MYKYAIQWFCAIALLVFPGVTRASFHLWQLNEIYSNADGTVQFIELSTAFGGQQFLAGHTMTSSQGATTHSFTFPSDLPGDSAGKTFLVGTTGFAALGVVAPDYIVPNGFLFTTNGNVNFAGVDSVSWAALPVDGTFSIDRSGVTAINSPKNFAGATGSVRGSSVISPSDCVFNWAEAAHSNLFTPAGALSQTLPPWYYRHYTGTNAYLGTSSTDNHLYYVGPASSRTLFDAGPLSVWQTTAGCP
jgi:hypothetical protein